MGRAIGEVPLEGPLVVRLRRVRDLDERFVDRGLRARGSHRATSSARLLIGHLTIVTERSDAMGFLDDAKKLAGKAEELAAEHSDQVKQGLDKVEDLADKATGGKYTDQIESAGDKAAGFVDGLDKS